MWVTLVEQDDDPVADRDLQRSDGPIYEAGRMLLFRRKKLSGS